ncbi:MAG: 3'-5' exonuclease [Patescibacteria group bacterium]|nr:3'-5' exonuclease [Patescibacteria group bacterium]
MGNKLGDLNPEQIKAVKQIDGPVLVLAGAGSGKTKALTHRIAYLMNEKNVSPQNILAITFTNKAAEEIRNRVKKLTQLKSDKRFNISTFHSLCAKLLRIESHLIGFNKSFSILDSDSQLTAVKQAMAYLQIDTKRVVPEAVRSHISSAKNELISAAEYANHAQGTFQRVVAKIYPVYQQIIERAQALDFDDLIMRTVRLFQESPETLAKYQNLFKYILIDEYQDTNTAQYTLSKLLAAAHRNIFVVGDDWQSIYSWRGANFRNILNFNTDYPDAVVIKLEQNYRSSQNILDAGHALIEKNRHKSTKVLWTDQPSGEPITIYAALSQRDEGDFIVREIQRLQTLGASLNEMVVLYRTNAQSRSLEEVMLQNQIPYKVVGGVKFYDRKEIRDMLAYLTLLVNIHDNLALGRIINEPTRGIGKQTLAKLEELAQADGKSTYLYILEGRELPPTVVEFKKMMTQLETKKKTLALSKLLDSLLVVTRYKQMLTDQGIEGETRLENIYELKSVMEKYDHLETEEALTTFLEEVSLISDIDNLDAKANGITLMTLHAAKGLEFDYVFIAGLEENIFPHSRAIFDSDELEEERRLAYVGVTRAKKKVYMIYAQERMLYGSLQNNPPSRFIEDIPSELVETIRPRGMSHLNQTVPSGQGRRAMEPGTKVVHQQFGEGIVISKTGNVLTVAFRHKGIKSLAEEFAHLRLKK